jgi:hypothetical protein
MPHIATSSAEGVVIRKTALAGGKPIIPGCGNSDHAPNDRADTTGSFSMKH